MFFRATSADPQNADARLACAMARFATGEYGVAADSLRQGIRMAPDIVNSALDVRDNYGNAEDFTRQGELLSRRVQGDPTDPDALLLLGFVCHFTGNRQDSAAIFQQVKVQSPADADIADIFLNAQPLTQGA
jgi:cytochrome c-type biogenesis protein CcmH/NrfG